jgi:hypothetical protein
VTDVERLMAERACERLSYDFAATADEGRHSQLANLFTADGLFAIPDLRLEGREAIRRFFVGREALTDLRTLHVLTNIMVDVRSPDAAHGLVYLTLYRRRSAERGVPVPTTRPALLGRYRDRYAREGSRWLFASRTQDVLFADPDDKGS